jgi:pyruvate/2-oxoglutarate/acetoin dehydrogenase E1 component
VVVAHHATLSSGFGAEVAARVNEELFGELEAPVARVGARFTAIGSAPSLEAAALPSAATIADAIRRVADR